MQLLSGKIVHNEVTKNAKGGSELMAERLHASLPFSLLKEFQIILSRVRELDESKIRILWCHDLADDTEAHHLSNGGWKKFHKIVFVSYWQRQQFIDRYSIPHSMTTVIQNAIHPLDASKRTASDKIRFIYHTTPHRGLELLVPIFNKLSETHKNIHLDVYSSFGVYGWQDRDKPYDGLFEIIKNHSNMSYHGAVSNDEIRDALLSADIYAYPCKWMETSCLSLIEAMSAGVICIHSNLGALPETAANLTIMYDHHEDDNIHAMIMYNNLNAILNSMDNGNKAFYNKAMMASDYMSMFYDVNSRMKQWNAFLDSMLGVPREFPKEKEPTFVYEIK